MTTSAPTIPSIFCIGAGYIGGPSMALIADCSANLRVNVPLNESRIVAWNEADLGRLPEASREGQMAGLSGEGSWLACGSVVEALRRAGLRLWRVGDGQQG